MMNNYVLWLFMLSFCSVAVRFGYVRKILSQNHCLEEGTPLRLEYPFPVHKGDAHRFVVVWLYNRLTWLEIFPGDQIIRNPRASVFGTFGLQIDDVTSNDAGRYEVTCRWKLLRQIISRIYIDVAILDTPKLKSEKLSLSHTFDEMKGFAKLTCGTVESLGDPPVSLVYKAPDNTTFDGVYVDGNLTLDMSMTEDLANAVTCELDKNSSAAVECIPEKELSRWTTASSEENQAEENQAVELSPHVQLILCFIFSSWISAVWA